MGELIKKYGKFKIGEKEFFVELNGPIDADNGGIIHIHAKDIRFEMSQVDFYKMVTSCNLAKENLKRLKGDGIDE